MTRVTMKMICVICGEAFEGSAHCPNCGTEKNCPEEDVVECSDCGRMNLPAAKCCIHCGEAFDDQVENDPADLPIEGNIMKSVLYGLIGAFVGAAVVRAFMLDTLEELGFRMFWQALRENGGGDMDLQKVVTSATFIKIALGTVVGSGVGFWIGERSIGADE